MNSLKPEFKYLKGSCLLFLLAALSQLLYGFNVVVSVF